MDEQDAHPDLTKKRELFISLNVTAGMTHTTPGIRMMWGLLGHESAEPMIDAHVLNKGGRGVASPLDGL